jgi:hypothetical protein
VAVSFIGGGNRKYPEKTTDLPQVTDKTLSHIVVSVARDGCIFMKEVGWNPDRTVMNENSIYNGTRMSNGVLLYKCVVHMVLSGVPRKVSTISNNLDFLLGFVVVVIVLKLAIQLSM